jgi:lipid-binding SYLF domain-containing protein
LNGDELDNAFEGSAYVAEVFHNIAVARNEIPQDVLLNAAAIGVFKGVFNLGFIGGHRQGNGAITVRTPNGWSAPVFYKLRSGGFGAQAGGSPSDYLLVFMSRESIRDIAEGEFDLNLDANAVAGPILGAEGKAGHPKFPRSKTVFVYSRSEGSFAGAVIDGAKLTARNSVNRDLYGTDALDLLSDPSPLPKLSDMCMSCLAPGVSDFPQMTAVALDSLPAYVAVEQPSIPTREDLALNRAAPHNRDRGVKVIVIKIINEDDDDEEDDEEEQVVVVRPQLQPVRAVNCCPRLHKKKL